MQPLNTIVPVIVNTIVFDDSTICVKNCVMTLADRLIESRTDAKLSQEELAEKVGCSVDMIRKLEQGARKSTTLIVKLAKTLNVNAEWLDDGSGEKLPTISYSNMAMQDLANYAIEHNKDKIFKVPLINFLDAWNYKSALENSGAHEIILTDAKVSKNTFAIKVEGDSMLPIFHPGMVVIIEPSLSPVPNDFVLAHTDENEPTLKQLIKDGPDWYLKPLNHQYPTKDASKYKVIGVVIQVQSVTRFK